jgi:hypothetical protein
VDLNQTAPSLTATTSRSGVSRDKDVGKEDAAVKLKRRKSGRQ